jgi:predicted metal-dependent phosphoesterase TrpH
MKLDIHIHSSHSNDGSVSPKEILKYAKKIGLQGIAVADHNDLSGSLKLAKDFSDEKDFVVIPAMEVSSSEGHIIALGIREAVNRRSHALAKELGCGRTGGSDSHSLEHIGKAYTVFDNPTWDVEGILEEIRKGRTKGEGTYRKPGETPRYVISCVTKWLKRGMRNI